MNLKSLRRLVRRRLQNLGVPRDAAATQSEKFVFQIRHMGESGSTSYIKRCGDTLLHYLYGTPQKAPWVATQCRFPSFFAPVKDCGEEVLLRVAKLARAIRFATIHPEQVDKVTLAVVTPYGGDLSALTHLSHLITMGVDMYSLRSLPLMERGNYQSRLVTKTFKKVQSTMGSTANVSEPPVRESLQLLADHPDFRVDGFESVFYPMTPESVRTAIGRLERPFEDRVPYVGEIHASQEGGGKLRMFASPYNVFSCMLYPLHYYLASVRDHVPTDCTKDQASGALKAQEWLAAGRTVHSVDLSTATCRFPLFPQIELLRTLRVDEQEIALLEYVCRGVWKCGVDVSTAFARTSLQWEVGQPLGIPPSMSMFSLAHNLLLAGLCVRLRLDPEDSFRVLGDDVVISVDDLAAEYISVLSLADIPVSASKSHCSTRYAEFAGYSITPRLMVRPGQWRPPTPANMLSLARELKTPLYGEVTKLGERIQKAFLFREGIYDPPPEDWPTFIKLNTGLALLHLERWTCYNAPLWYYKIMEVIDNQLPGQVVGYIWDEPSFDRAIFSPLFDFCQAYEKEEHGPLKQMIYPLYMTSRRSQTSEALGMFRVYEALSWLWDVGALTQSEYHTLTNDVLEVARSLLYMPTKASVENELSYIGKQLSRLMELAITSKAELDDSPYIPVSDWSDDLVPQYWLR